MAGLEGVYFIYLTQDDLDEVRLADLHETDDEINSIGFRYYTLESRPIPYKSPNISTHPATIKAKEAADSLNDAYQKASDTHQMIRCKLIEFKKLVGQPEYADLKACFAGMKVLSGEAEVRLVCSDVTNDPLKLVGGAWEVQHAIKVFNGMLDTCHEFLQETDSYLERISQRIEALRMLAVMQQILTICATFEAYAATNVNIFATEIRSLLLDTRSAAKQSFKY